MLCPLAPRHSRRTSAQPVSSNQYMARESPHLRRDPYLPGQVQLPSRYSARGLHLMHAQPASAALVRKTRFPPQLRFKRGSSTNLALNSSPHEPNHLLQLRRNTSLRDSYYHLRPPPHVRPNQLVAPPPRVRGGLAYLPCLAARKPFPGGRGG